MLRTSLILGVLVLLAPPLTAQSPLADQIRARLGNSQLGKARSAPAPKIARPTPRLRPAIPGLAAERIGPGGTPLPAPLPGAEAKLEAFKKGWSTVMQPALSPEERSKGLGVPDYLNAYGLLKPGKVITSIDAPLYFRYWQGVGLSAAARGDRETVRMAISQLRRLDLQGFLGVRERVIEQLKAQMPKPIKKPGAEEADEAKDPYNYRLIDRLTQRNSPTGEVNPGTKPPGGR